MPDAVAAPPAPERRALQRRHVAGRCTLRREAETPAAADLFDLSADGAGVWSAKPVFPGEAVEFSLQGRGMSIKTAAVVVNARRVGEGAWRIGLFFVHRLRPDELAAALD
jgi:hypothetical protein